MRFKLLLPFGVVQERWQQDRKLFMARAKELGASVLLQNARFEDAVRDIRQGHLKAQRVDVLVVVPPPEGNAAEVVQAAHQAGVIVIAYDRMIQDCDLDLYCSFDNVRVGEMQAGYLVKLKPKGDYLLIGGPPSEGNTHMYREGQMKVLKPFLDRGDIRIVDDQWAKDWQPLEATRITEEALDKNQGRLDAVLASNDGTAEGAIYALTQKGLEGKTQVTGQDADLMACQRLLTGTQCMTVYKPIQHLATKTAEAAVELACKKPLSEKTVAFHNGRKQVPGILCEPILVNKGNLEDTVIAEGFHTREEIFE